MFGTSLQNNPRVVDFLSNGLKRQELHHAYCFVGPDHSGKRTLVRDFAKALMCFGESATRACGACTSCTQTNHADMLTLDGETEALSIELVREWLQSLTLTSFGKGRRVGVLYHAHTLPERTQNVLLKTLEEPPANTVILLTSNAPLIPTIMSRVQSLRILPRNNAATGREESARQFESLMQNGVTNELMGELTAEEASITRQRIIALFEAGQHVVRGKLVGGSAKGGKIFPSSYAMIQALDAMRISVRALQVNADPRLVLENFYYRVALKV